MLMGQAAPLPGEKDGMFGFVGDGFGLTGPRRLTPLPRSSASLSSLFGTSPSVSPPVRRPNTEYFITAHWKPSVSDCDHHGHRLPRKIRTFNAEGAADAYPTVAKLIPPAFPPSSPMSSSHTLDSQSSPWTPRMTHLRASTSSTRLLHSPQWSVPSMGLTPTAMSPVRPHRWQYDPQPRGKFR